MKMRDLSEYATVADRIAHDRGFFDEYLDATSQTSRGDYRVDEPTLVLSARDVYASQVVRYWAKTLLLNHGQSLRTDEAFALADRMDVWRALHGGDKVPE